MAKRIVFLADCLVTQTAGIHHYAHQFIEQVITTYPDNQYYIVVPQAYGKFDAQEIVVPIKAIPFHYRLRSFFSIPKAIKAVNPDLVIEMAHFGPFSLPQGITTCTVIHDLTPILHPEWHDQISHLWHKLFLNKALAKQDFVITNSEFTKEEIHRYISFPKENIVVCPPHVTTSKTPDSKNKNGEYLLTVGTIEPRKNYETLIKAFDLIAEKYPELKLIIVGKKGWKYETVYTALNDSKYADRIQLLGYVTAEEKSNLYKHALAFVYPTHYEGYGIPLVEAMHYHLPVICSDITICREVCGEAAIYFDRTKADDVAPKVKSVLESTVTRTALINKSKTRSTELSRQKIDLDAIMDRL